MMQNSAPKTFKKNERLKSRKEILRLMSRGHRMESYPVLAKYSFNPLPSEGAATNKVMVVAPKKLFKKAVDRNLLKRRMREAYRLNKELLPPCCAHISFQYIAKEKLKYSQIEEAVKNILKTIAEQKPEDSQKSADTAVKAVGQDGKDNEASVPDSDKKGNSVLSILKKIAIFPLVVLVKFYQVCISPLKPATCRFTPTCSQYAIEALRKHGPFKGLYLALRRILRCHPWGGHGYDPVP